MEFTNLKGFKDILPEDVRVWQRLESKVRSVLRSFGFHEIKPPIIERTELFSRSIGLDTDIVSKEMYSIVDAKGKSISLRPEATASVARAYIQHRLYDKNPVQKLFTFGPMFRRERPQKGRFRQFYQINAEILGDSGPRSDADLIILATTILNEAGLSGLTLYLNSLGCSQCRPRFRQGLQEYLSQKTDVLCSDCQKRAKTNPLRVFDCKVETCNEVVSDAPSILDHICQDCRGHFDSLQAYLTDSDIFFVLNHRLVRGLDYYTRTSFEFQTEHPGAQNAVCGGGRYDGLLKLLGGPDHPAIGFAMGIERLIDLLGDVGKGESPAPELFVAGLGEKAEEEVFGWVRDLRKAGIWVEMEYGSKGLKAQMKKADRLGAKKVLMVGDDELASGKGILRDMETKEQKEIDLKNIVNELKKVLQKNE
ncbi:MAG: histidine--tRNA ligase [Deltaproteobacteria bacterium]|nr:histidine--tRNA ligase [Deltaproteobacteria bacterium]